MGKLFLFDEDMSDWKFIPLVVVFVCVAACLIILSDVLYALGVFDFLERS